MKDFFKKIKKSLKLMKYPYNDEKTQDDILEATQKTVEYCKKLKDMK